MAHTFASLHAHVVFSTKGRDPCLDPPFRERLVPYMGGILRELDVTALLINGPSDHVHLFLTLPPARALAEVLRILKTNSSRWVHEQWPDRRAFAWQAGYGAFSVSASNLPRVQQYIADQEAHHRQMTFQEEFIAFLRRHGIVYDERYIWE